MQAEGGILTPSKRKQNSPSLLVCYGDLAGRLKQRSIKERFGNMIRIGNNSLLAYEGGFITSGVFL
jgi:hypothetical protein